MQYGSESPLLSADLSPWPVCSVTRSDWGWGLPPVELDIACRTLPSGPVRVLAKKSEMGSPGDTVLLRPLCALDRVLPDLGGSGATPSSDRGDGESLARPDGPGDFDRVRGDLGGTGDVGVAIITEEFNHSSKQKGGNPKTLGFFFQTKENL